MDEVWKDIKGYEGFYQASNTGLVKSLDRYIFDSTGVQKYYKGRMVKMFKDRKGYLFVTLSKNGICKRFPTHRIIAMTFIENPQNLPIINHKDEVPSNNFVFINDDGTVNPEKSNLEWCTYKYNTNYGTAKTRRSHNHPRIKTVCMFNLEGNLEKEFHCIREAARFVNGNHPTILLYCSGSRKEYNTLTYKGKFWCFKGEEHKIKGLVELYKRLIKRKEVVVTYSDGTMTTYESLASARKELKIGNKKLIYNNQDKERGIKWKIRNVY